MTSNGTSGMKLQTRAEVPKIISIDAHGGKWFRMKVPSFRRLRNQLQWSMNCSDAYMQVCLYTSTKTTKCIGT